MPGNEANLALELAEPLNIYRHVVLQIWASPVLPVSNILLQVGQHALLTSNHFLEQLQNFGSCCRAASSTDSY